MLGAAGDQGSGAGRGAKGAPPRAGRGSGPPGRWGLPMAAVAVLQRRAAVRTPAPSDATGAARPVAAAAAAAMRRLAATDGDER